MTNDVWTTISSGTSCLSATGGPLYTNYTNVGPTGWVSPGYLVEERKRDLKTETIVAGEIVAWRLWKLDKSGYLHSISSRYTWYPDEIAEGDVNRAGIYAFKSIHGARILGASYASCSDQIVMGRVALWGDVIEHQRGYRAQYAKPLSLGWVEEKYKRQWFNFNGKAALRRSLKLYKVPYED